MWSTLDNWILVPNDNVIASWSPLWANHTRTRSCDGPISQPKHPRMPGCFDLTCTCLVKTHQLQKWETNQSKIIQLQAAASAHRVGPILWFHYKTGFGAYQRWTKSLISIYWRARASNTKNPLQHASEQRLRMPKHCAFLQSGQSTNP